MTSNYMQDHAIIYVPSDTPEAMALAPRKVGGVPLIIRGIMTLSQAGINSCTLIVAAPQRERIEGFLNRYRRDRLPTIDMVTYDEPYRVSPAMIEQIAAKLKKRALLINANLLFSSELVQTIYDHDPSTDEIFVCKEGVHPLPIMEITREAWESLSQFTCESARSIESCIRHLKDSFPRRDIEKPANVNAFVLKRREDIPVAEKFLAEGIRRATNGLVAKFINKRISLPIAMLLTKMWVSPHVVTSFNIVVGLLSGVIMAGGGYMNLLVGAALFQAASIVDGVDGEIAKLSFRCSRFGQYIDTISDNLALASLLVGLTIGAYRTLGTNSIFIAGGLAIAMIGAIIALMIRFLKRNTNSASLVTFDKEYLQKRSDGEHRIIMTFLRYNKHFAKKDIFSFIILVLAIAGLLQYWIYFIALGGTLGFLSLIYLNLADAQKATNSSLIRDATKRLKKMVVFDFDGTLVNSMEQFADIASEVIKKYYGVPLAEARAQYLRTSGLPFFQQLETLFPGNANNSIAAAEYEEKKKDGYFDRPVFDDAAKAIKALRADGIKVAVSSNNFQDLVDQFVKQKNITFDEVLGYRDNFAKGEDHFRHIEKTHGIDRRDITFVGDSLKDGERAVQSGVQFVAREGTFARSEFNREFPGSKVVSSLEELKELI
jgi:phosphoglycolate phosphatase-like HAD superfamily hydrolase/phosphatidylglycerophosphate synthase